MKCRLIFTFTLISFCFVPASAQQNDISGVKLVPRGLDEPGKTSLFINGGDPITLLSSFSISFDISFWRLSHFGPFLRVIDDAGNEVRLQYLHHKNRDSSNIILLLPSEHKQLSVIVAKKHLIRNKWFNLELKFDKQTNEIKVFFNDSLNGKIAYRLKDKRHFSFIFGIKNLDDPSDLDLPGLAIKNISIKEEEEQKHFWSLNPRIKTIDEVGGLKLKVVNAGWVYSDHAKWRKRASYRIQESHRQHYGVAFDSINSRLFIDSPDRLIIYDLITQMDSLLKYNSTFPIQWNDLLYDYGSEQLYSFMTGMGSVSVYDLNLNEWIEKDTSFNQNAQYFGSAKFVNPADGSLYLLGGYGIYKAKNDLFRYNFSNRNWEKIKLNINEMLPGAFFAFGKGFNEGEYLIYGGTGNETGDQEFGFRMLNNLYVLNINDLTIKKIDIPLSDNFPHSILSTDIYTDKKDSSFYFLSFLEENKKFTIGLEKLDLKTGKFIKMADRFWHRNEDKWMYARLHFNESTKELVSVIYDSTTVEIFTLNFPPVSQEESFVADQKTEDDTSLTVIIFSVLGVIAVTVVLFIRQWKKRKNSTNPRSVVQDSFYYAENETFRNTIKLFGGFQIYANNGKNIALDFSPKLKEVLLLILLRSFNHGLKKGITSEELSSIIWPDLSPENIKSNRGVAINRIRKLLEHVDGLTLDFENKLWIININPGFRFDYTEFLQMETLVKEKKINLKESVDLLSGIFYGGEFLKDFSYGWLDGIKFSINNKIIAFLKTVLEDSDIREDHEKLIRVCDIILSFDVVDIDAARAKIRALNNTGKINAAKNSFNLFIAEYKRLYDEEFPETYHDFIKF